MLVILLTKVNFGGGGAGGAGGDGGQALAVVAHFDIHCANQLNYSYLICRWMNCLYLVQRMCKGQHQRLHQN